MHYLASDCQLIISVHLAGAPPVIQVIRCISVGRFAARWQNFPAINFLYLYRGSLPFAFSFFRYTVRSLVRFHFTNFRHLRTITSVVGVATSLTNAINYPSFLYKIRVDAKNEMTGHERLNFNICNFLPSCHDSERWITSLDSIARKGMNPLWRH